SCACFAHGSFVTNQSNNFVAWSWNEATIDKAISSAMQHCNSATQCMLIENFRDTCLAIAKSPTNFYYYALHGNSNLAKDDARARCYLTTGLSCTDFTAVCDRTPIPDSPAATFNSSGLPAPVQLTPLISLLAPILKEPLLLSVLIVLLGSVVILALKASRPPA